jgi:alpha-2-macroglobulin
MKRFVATCLLLSVCSLSAQEAAKPGIATAVAPGTTLLKAKFEIMPPEFGPDSTLELTFPTPMIQPDEVGSKAAVSPLIILPEIKGEFEWTSTRSGIYRLLEAPQFDASYRFDLRSGLKDLAGNSYIASKLEDTNTEEFRITEQDPKWWDNEDVKRLPEFLFQFNDTITAEAAAGGMAFKSEQNKLRVSVTARYATMADFDKHYADPVPTWAEKAAHQEVKLSKEQPRKNAIIITPTEPLPQANDWILDIATTIVNENGSSELHVGDAIRLGKVKPFTVSSIKPHVWFDRPKFIDVQFSRDIVQPNDDAKVFAQQAKDAAATWQSLIQIEPAVNGCKLEVFSDILRISSDEFQLHTPYTVTVRSGGKSADQMPLREASPGVAVFTPNPPYVAVPAYINSQLSSGKGQFEFSAANVSQVRVRAKKLTGPQLLRAVELMQPYVSYRDASEKQRAAFKHTPFEQYDGVAIYDRTFPINKALDQSELQCLAWKEILGADTATAPLFLELEGTAMQGTQAKSVIAQSLINFTDIGLFHKDDGTHSTVYAVSLQTGKPMPKVKVMLMDKEHKLLGYGDSNEQGMANITSSSPSYVLAECGQDCTALLADTWSSTIPMWNFDVPTTGIDPWQTRQRTLLFADRDVYKPGEVVHVKAYTRSIMGDELSLRPDLKAKLKLRDPRYRVTQEREMTFSSSGSWTGEISLPSNQVGAFHLSIEFPENEAAGNSNDESGSLTFNVADYKPNSFEIKIDPSKLSIEADKATLPLTASYLMGKSLSKAKVSWNAFREEGSVLFPEHKAYHFGDAPVWANYGKDYDPSHEDEEEQLVWDGSGNGALGSDGSYKIEMKRPTGPRAQLPLRVELSAEVTDMNEQTINKSVKFLLPGTAEQIIGLRGPSMFGYAGEELKVSAIVLGTDGKFAREALPSSIVIERQSYQTLTVELAGGGQTQKNQCVLNQVSKQDLSIDPRGSDIAFTPEKAGTYFITAQSSNGALSRMPFYVIGGNEFPWASRDGMQMDILTEKKNFKPGEEAVLAIKTPFAAKALVTIERNQVERSFHADISPENPVIKVPITAEDAPVIYVSVLVVRGSESATTAAKLPEFRMGYCQLMVEDHTHDLSIQIQPEKNSVKPGEKVPVTVSLTGNDKAPVANAEVTLCAVDEGVLSLTNYKTPEPLAFFHEPAALAVNNNTSFSSLLTEDDKARTRGNKGIVIGGGGEEGDVQLETRKNFIATPLWLGTGLTDSQGKLSTSFTAPDNLTRYRIMAVASEGTSRFGSTESPLIVSKPLMIEPVIARFARVNDEFLVKALVHNTTADAGTATVTLTLDSKADFITEQRPFVLISTKASDSSPEGKTWTRQIQLAAGQSMTLSYPVKITTLGDTCWNWSVQTNQWPKGIALNDATVSQLKVEHPMPQLRDVRYFALNPNTPIENALGAVSPQVLEGEQGEVDLQISGSRLPEVQDALDYVLQYPYGCVEQTSSSTIPWIAMQGLEEFFPQLQQRDGKAAIQAGVNRLSSMITERGGLSYWPGGSDPDLFGSAYAGLTLLKARDQGIDIPQKVIDELLVYLSGQLRQLEDEKSDYVLCDSAMALYALAKGGRAEPAYQNTLYNKRDKLPRLAKSFLALAMLISKAPEIQATTLLGVSSGATSAKTSDSTKSTKTSDAAKSGKGKSTAKTTTKSSKPSSTAKASSKAKSETKDSSNTSPAVAEPKPSPPAPVPVVTTWEHWVGSDVNDALRLIAFTHMGKNAEAQESMNRLLSTRTADGAWRNTFTNAWALTALAAHQRSRKDLFLHKSQLTGVARVST